MQPVPWSGEVEAPIGWQLSFGVFAAMALTIAPCGLHRDALRMTVAAFPDDGLALVEIVALVGRCSLADNLAEVAQPAGRIFAHDTHHVHRAQDAARKRARAHRDHDQTAKLSWNNIVQCFPVTRQQVVRFVQDDPMWAPVRGAQRIQERQQPREIRWSIGAG